MFVYLFFSCWQPFMKKKLADTPAETVSHSVALKNHVCIYFALSAQKKR